jgi:hypothetical protein
VKGLLTLGFDPAPFPDEAVNLLSDPRTVTQTELPPASDDEFTNNKIHRYVAALPPALLGARKCSLSSSLPGQTITCHNLVPGEQALGSPPPGI